jgi:hypothetical protein
MIVMCTNFNLTVPVQMMMMLVDRSKLVTA